jgi:hypothetical protein
MQEDKIDHDIKIFPGVPHGEFYRNLSYANWMLIGGVQGLLSLASTKTRLL